MGFKKVDEIDDVLQKGYGFLKQKKEISNPFQLFFCFENPYSFFLFDFVGADHCFFGILKFSNQRCK
ncbi:hypothetical protein [Flavobacterium soyangense]|uniref:hypothetical protein n=1 Tax=Flavobacterium soyangense TaxID=2023265 RepID=UPI0018880F2C|nr:hypothetical protein [Flavobacterium soyangense]